MCAPPNDGSHCRVGERPAQQGRAGAFSTRCSPRARVAAPSPTGWDAVKRLPPEQGQAPSHRPHSQLLRAERPQAGSPCTTRKPPTTPSPASSTEKESGAKKGGKRYGATVQRAFSNTNGSLMCRFFEEVGQIAHIRRAETNYETDAQKTPQIALTIAPDDGFLQLGK